jgi:Fuc2NAc and GlcNAc transferase
MAALVWMYLAGTLPDAVLAAFLAAGLLVAGIGFLDDHTSVPAVYRFLVHLASAVFAVYVLGGLPPLQVGFSVVDLGIAGSILAVVFLVWLVNLFNFMDGIDGLAASEAVFIAGAALLVGTTDINSYIISLKCFLIAGTVGFLLWNWSPAKIFLGDIGSGFLGITLGILALVSAAAGDLPVWTWLVLAGVFVVDATFTLVRRFLRGERWYSAHRSHAYQKLSRRVGSHASATFLINILNVAWLLPLAWLTVRYPEYGFWVVWLAWLPLLGIAVFLKAGSEDVADAG